MKNQKKLYKLMMLRACLPRAGCPSPGTGSCPPVPLPPCATGPVEGHPALFGMLVRKVSKLGFLGFALLLAGQAYAVCPLCVVAVGAGVGLTHYLGIDDTITGLWLGGLIVALIGWTIVWLNKKNIHFKFRIILTTILYYTSVIWPLYSAGIMGHPLNTLWGVDKLLLGTIIGSIVFFIFMLWYFHMKKQHGGHAYFPFQKVVMPIVPLVVLSIVFHFIAVIR